MKQKSINQFFDINKLPAQEGLLIFPISMSRISNSQSGIEYIKVLKKFETKVSRTLVGANFIYTDSLYERYNIIKGQSDAKNLNLVLTHKNSFLKSLIKKTKYIEQGFSFLVWNQLIIEYPHFPDELKKVQKKYEKDKLFQKYVKEDIKKGIGKVTQNNINFILEETFLTYLILHQKINIQNDFINGRDKWRLICYPGKPNKSMAYFLKLNMFKFESNNRYNMHHYDLTENTLYDYNNLDLETLEL